MMSALLRFARITKYHSIYKNFVQLSSISNRQAVCNRIPAPTPERCQGTLAAHSILSKDNRLDKSLRRLDEDVRRSGRISRKEFEEILEELQHARYATSSQSLLIIRCCGNLLPEEAPEVRTLLVNELWKTLENMGVQMDVSHYNALLRVYLENEHSFSPTEFLSNLEAKGIEPNRVTYQRLIARYCQLGDVEGATRILEFMRERNLPVNECVFNALIMGHSHANDMESATGIMTVMQQAGLEPSTETYKTLICGYSKCGDLNAVRRVLDECTSKQVYFMDRDYMDIIYELAVNNHPAIIDEIIGKMRQIQGYNQEAINLILRLMTKGKDDVAKKIFLTMPKPLKPDGSPIPAGNFMLKQMVRLNRTVEEIEQFCQSLEEGDLNSGALIQAAEFSLQFGLIDLSCSLLSILKKDGFPIRAHYFWPLLAHQGKKKDTKGLIEVLRRMESQFNISPSGETLKDYVVPLLNHLSPGEIIQSLKTAGLTNATAAFAVVLHLLHENKLADAVKVASDNSAYYSPAIIRRPLLEAFLLTKDVKSYVSMLHLVHDGLHRISDTRQDDDSTGSTVPIGAEITGQFLVDLVANPIRDKGETFHKILEGLVAHGLSISNIVAEEIADKLSEEKEIVEISTLLGTLTTGDLTPLPVKRQQLSSVLLTDKQLKSKIAYLENKGESTHLVKRQLLGLYCRNKDLDKAEVLKQELEAENVLFTSATYIQLIDLYCHHEKLNEALCSLNKLKENDPDYTLAGLKIVRLAALLVKSGKLDECLTFLQEYPHQIKEIEHSFIYNSTCWKMLNTLAELGQHEQVKQLFDILLKRKYIEVNNVLLGPLIKAYLVRDDLPGALSAFEMCVKEHSCTPWKNELAVRLIQADNPEQLQKLTDLSTEVHGESNSLYDLVFAFVECGRIRAARKILETPGLHRSSQRLSTACERYRQDGRISNLEGLIEVTRDNPHINRSAIFYQLLLSYCKIDDVDKALGLWTRMQEEDVHTTDDFLYTLGSFLEKHGKKVPFTIPKISSEPEEKSQFGTDNFKAFKSAINTDDLDAALDIKRRSSDFIKSKLSVTSLSNLLEKLSKAGRQSEALKLIFDMLEQNLYPKPEVLRVFLNQLALAGDMENISKIGSYLTSDVKKRISYDNKLCHAYVTSGQANVYLQNLDKLIENLVHDDLTTIAESFPRGGALGLLQTGPDIVQQYEIVARKYAACGINSPINILWIHMFMNGQKEAADKLWSEFLSRDDKIMFTPIVTKAKVERDAALVEHLLSKLKTIPVSTECLGHVYSIFLHILIDQGNYIEAINTLENAIQVTDLENLTTNVLQRLKAAVTAEGMTFPYEIPDKVSLNSSSLSDSDDGGTKTSIIH